jgi:hypothetical protein
MRSACGSDGDTPEMRPSRALPLAGLAPYAEWKRRYRKVLNLPDARKLDRRTIPRRSSVLSSAAPPNNPLRVFPKN